MARDGKGREHVYFLHVLSLGIPDGVARVSEDTGERAAWLQANPHWPPAAFLIAGLAYVEGICGKNWPSSYEGAKKPSRSYERDLRTLVMCRNALVHFGGRLDSLDKPQWIVGGKIIPSKDPKGCRDYVEAFVRDLATRHRAHAPKNTDAQGQPVFEPYLEVASDSTVKLSDQSYHPVASLLMHALQVLGKFQ